MVFLSSLEMTLLRVQCCFSHTQKASQTGSSCCDWREPHVKECVIVLSQGKTTLNKPKQAHLQWYGLCFMNASDEGIQQREFKSLQHKRSSVDSGIKDLQDGDYSRPQDSQLKFLKRWQPCLLSWIMRIDVPLCSVCRVCSYTPLHSSLLTLQTSVVSTSMSTHILHPLLLQSSQKRTALHSEHISITTVYFT